MPPPPSRLILLRSAPTAATRRAAFPDDEPLDVGGTRAASALALVPSLQRAERVLTSPALRARQTAALGPAVTASIAVTIAVDEALAAANPGEWRGLTLDEVATREPERLAAWLEDPDVRPPGGESRRELLGRVGACLGRLHAGDPDPNGDVDRDTDTTVTIAVTHSGWVRAAVLLVLSAPLAAFWRIDVAPARDHHWRAGNR